MKELLTPDVVKYLQSLAHEHIEGGFEDDDRDYHHEREVLWGMMSPEERNTANELVDAIFGEWL